MVANVSDVAGTTGNGRTAGEAGSEAAGFLQALLGLTAPMPSSEVSPAMAGMTAASASADPADDVQVNASPDTLAALPAWLMAASVPAAVETPAQESPLPAARPATSVLSSTLVQEMAQGLAQTLAPDDSNNSLPTSPVGAAAPPLTSNTQAAIVSTPASGAPSLQPMPQAQQTEAELGDPSAQISFERPQPAAVPSQAAAVAAAKPADAGNSASAFDIDNFLAKFAEEREFTPARNTAPAAAAAAQTESVSAHRDSGTALHEAVAAADLGVDDAMTLTPDEEPEDAVDVMTVPAPKTGDTTPSTTQTALAGAENADAEPVAGQRLLQARLGSAEWKEQLGAQLSWMAENGKHSASLKLTPEHLGTVEVRIDVNQNQTSIWFSAANAEARTALEQALPRLREMMSAQGMTLNDAGVFREPPREQRHSPGHAPTSFGFQEAGEETLSVGHRSTSLLDTYA